MNVYYWSISPLNPEVKCFPFLNFDKCNQFIPCLIITVANVDNTESDFQKF